jgi:hypothetical protein
MIRAANFGEPRAAGAPELTPTESLALAAIACLQPATRAEIVRLWNDAEVSRSLRSRQPARAARSRTVGRGGAVTAAASEAALDAALGVGDDLMKRADDQ